MTTVGGEERGYGQCGDRLGEAMGLYDPAMGLLTTTSNKQITQRW